MEARDCEHGELSQGLGEDIPGGLNKQVKIGTHIHKAGPSYHGIYGEKALGEEWYPRSDSSGCRDRR